LFGGIHLDITQRKITKIAREVSKFTVRTLKADGIGTSELDFIHALRKTPGITQAEICKKLGIDKSAVAWQAACLELKGYLIRKPNPADGRSQLLYATEKSESLKNSKARVEAEFYEWLTVAFSENEREEFARLLDILYQRCKRESKSDFSTISEIIKEDK
jgi:DNA-binding MarR family transcriptional regulator